MVKFESILDNLQQIVDSPQTPEELRQIFFDISDLGELTPEIADRIEKTINQLKEAASEDSALSLIIQELRKKLRLVEVGKPSPPKEKKKEVLQQPKLEDVLTTPEAVKELEKTLK